MPSKPEPRSSPGSVSASRSSSAAKAPSRTSINFVLDSALLVNFVGLAINVLVVRFVFPRATTAAGWQVWGFSLDDWLNGQAAIVGLFAILVLIHVMLHWNWVCGVIASRLTRRWPQLQRADDGVRTLYGVGLLIALLAITGLTVGVAALSIVAPRY